MALSRRLRFEILRRDQHTCRYCGGKAPDIPLTVDHVIPTALGGTDEPSNLVTACQPCNAGKTSIQPNSPVVDDVKADAFRWADAIREVAIRLSIDRDLTDVLVADFDEAWSSWTYQTSDDGERAQIQRPNDWRESTERFLKAGAQIDMLLHLIQVAMRKQNIVHEARWTYFCGCAWRHINDLHEGASAILARQEAADGA